MSRTKNYYEEQMNYQFDNVDDFDYYLYSRDMNEYQEQLEEQKRLEEDAMWEDYSYSI